MMKLQGNVGEQGESPASKNSSGVKTVSAFMGTYSAPSCSWDEVEVEIPAAPDDTAAHAQCYQASATDGHAMPQYAEVPDPSPAAG